jgi:tetraacyldisaccharide 4'-kinase
LVVGGSGKTPFTIGLANWLGERWRVGVLSRGYRRRSRGVVLVAEGGRLKVSPEVGGDEPVEIGERIGGVVVVAEDRWAGLQKLVELGVEIAILDDGFRHPIWKVELLLDPPVKNPLCLPAGPYRLPKFLKRRADLILEEGVHFHRKITGKKGDILVAGISRPERLLQWVEVEEVQFFPDHHLYRPEEVAQWRGKRIVTTWKDWVKLREFGVEAEVLEVEVELTPLFRRQFLSLLREKFPNFS